MTTSLEIIFKACMSSKKIVVGERTIVITPKFSKRDFFESLNDMGKDTEKKYFDYFGYSEMAIKLYPTIKGIKDEYNIDYQKLSEIGKLNLKSILGHSSIMDTLKYYKGIDDLSIDNFDETFKDGDVIDYLEFVKYFGNNRELYEKLKHLKGDSLSSWKEIRNLKWKDVDLENGIINIETEEIDIS